MQSGSLFKNPANPPSASNPSSAASLFGPTKGAPATDNKPTASLFSGGAAPATSVPVASLFGQPNQLIPAQQPTAQSPFPSMIAQQAQSPLKPTLTASINISGTSQASSNPSVIFSPTKPLDTKNVARIADTQKPTQTNPPLQAPAAATGTAMFSGQPQAPPAPSANASLPLQSSTNYSQYLSMKDDEFLNRINQQRFNSQQLNSILKTLFQDFNEVEDTQRYRQASDASGNQRFLGIAESQSLEKQVHFPLFVAFSQAVIDTCYQKYFNLSKMALANSYRKYIQSNSSIIFEDGPNNQKLISKEIGKYLLRGADQQLTQKIDTEGKNFNKLCHLIVDLARDWMVHQFRRLQIITNNLPRVIVESKINTNALLKLTDNLLDFLERYGLVEQSEWVVGDQVQQVYSSIEAVLRNKPDVSRKPLIQRYLKILSDNYPLFVRRRKITSKSTSPQSLQSLIEVPLVTSTAIYTCTFEALNFKGLVGFIFQNDKNSSNIFQEAPSIFKDFEKLCKQDQYFSAVLPTIKKHLAIPDNTKIEPLPSSSNVRGRAWFEWFMLMLPRYSRSDCKSQEITEIGIMLIRIIQNNPELFWKKMDTNVNRRLSGFLNHIKDSHPEIFFLMMYYLVPSPDSEQLVLKNAFNSYFNQKSTTDVFDASFWKSARNHCMIGDFSRKMSEDTRKSHYIPGTFRFICKLITNYPDKARVLERLENKLHLNPGNILYDILRHAEKLTSLKKGQQRRSSFRGGEREATSEAQFTEQQTETIIDIIKVINALLLDEQTKEDTLDKIDSLDISLFFLDSPTKYNIKSSRVYQSLLTSLAALSILIIKEDPKLPLLKKVLGFLSSSTIKADNKVHEDCQLVAVRQLLLAVQYEVRGLKVDYQRERFIKEMLEPLKQFDFDSIIERILLTSDSSDGRFINKQVKQYMESGNKNQLQIQNVTNALEIVRLSLKREARILPPSGSNKYLDENELLVDKCRKRFLLQNIPATERISRTWNKNYINPILAIISLFWTKEETDSGIRYWTSATLEHYKTLSLTALRTLNQIMETSYSQSAVGTTTNIEDKIMNILLNEQFYIQERSYQNSQFDLKKQSSTLQHLLKYLSRVQDMDMAELKGALQFLLLLTLHQKKLIRVIVSRFSGQLTNIMRRLIKARDTGEKFQHKLAVFNQLTLLISRIIEDQYTPTDLKHAGSNQYRSIFLTKKQSLHMECEYLSSVMTSYISTGNRNPRQLLQIESILGNLCYSVCAKICSSEISQPEEVTVILYHLYSDIVMRQVILSLMRKYPIKVQSNRVDGSSNVEWNSDKSRADANFQLITNSTHSESYRDSIGTMCYNWWAKLLMTLALFSQTRNRDTRIAEYKRVSVTLINHIIPALQEKYEELPRLIFLAIGEQNDTLLDKFMEDCGEMNQRLTTMMNFADRGSSDTESGRLNSVSTAYKALIYAYNKKQRVSFIRAALYLVEYMHPRQKLREKIDKLQLMLQQGISGSQANKVQLFYWRWAICICRKLSLKDNFVQEKVLKRLIDLSTAICNVPGYGLSTQPQVQINLELKQDYYLLFSYLNSLEEYQMGIQKLIGLLPGLSHLVNKNSSKFVNQRQQHHQELVPVRHKMFDVEILWQFFALLRLHSMKVLITENTKRDELIIIENSLIALLQRALGLLQEFQDTARLTNLLEACRMVYMSDEECEESAMICTQVPTWSAQEVRENLNDVISWIFDACLQLLDGFYQNFPLPDKIPLHEQIESMLLRSKYDENTKRNFLNRLSDLRNI